MKKLTVLYDDWCPLCSRFARAVKRADWLKLVRLLPLRATAPTSHLRGLDKELASRQLATFNGRWHYGFASMLLIAKRLPLLWPLLPLALMLKYLGLGQFLYVKFAAGRSMLSIHCQGACNS